MFKCRVALWFISLGGASLAAAGCEQAAPPRISAASGVDQASPRNDLPGEQRSTEFFGSWLVRILSANGTALQNYASDMILLVGINQLEVISQCVTIGPFEYFRTSTGGIRVEQIEVHPRRGPAASPAPVQCARALSPAEAAVGPLLLGATEIQARTDGTVLLSGDEGTMILSRPAGTLKNPRGQAPPPPVPPSLGAWRFLTVNGRTLPSNEKMELLLRPGHIEFRSGCVSDVRGLRRDGDHLLPGDVEPIAACERARSPTEALVETLISAPVATRMERDGRLRLHGSGVTAELVPLTS